MAKVGIVVIGRNEEPRLAACLESLASFNGPKVYVDSGSRDRSPVIAAEHGFPVIRLTTGPYTAARGRQTGLDELCHRHPELEYVQFVDGDCILQPGWLATAETYLDCHADVAVVVGRLRERRTNTSLLVRLVDADWDLPTGDIDAIGGISMARIRPIYEAGGWNTNLIAGEELDLGARLRERGWRLIRLADEMTLHDIGITRVTELWKRGIRSGFSYAELAARHGRNRCRRWRRRAIGNVVYGAILPLLFVGFLWFWRPGAVLIGVLYAVLAARIAHPRLRRGDSIGFALLYAFAIMLLKAAAAIGTVRYLFNRLRGQQGRLIEYKSAGGPA